MARYATQDEQVREHVDNVDPLELACDPDRQAFVRELAARSFGSSTTLSIRILRPSCVRASTKSYDHT